MRQVVHFSGTTVGKKILMAATGAVLVLWVIAHMLGNLKAFQGPEHINRYAEGLRHMGGPFFGPGQLLWLVRIVLLFCVGVHVVAGIQLWLRSRAARPIGYRWEPHLELSYASRTMRWGGVVLALYVVYHLLHFTWGSVHPDFRPGDVYHNLLVAFRSWPVVLGYAVAVGALALHLYHGVWSAMQTLGLSHPRYNAYRRTAAGVVAGAIFVGFLSVPAAVLVGLLR